MILYEQNLFVHIMGWNLDVKAVAKAIGLRSVYGSSTGPAKQFASSIKIFADLMDNILEVQNRVPDSECVIASEDLETYCQGLSSDFVSDLYNKKSRRMLPKTIIDVIIKIDQFVSISGTTAQHRLLNPLRTLHGLRELRINSSGDSQLCAYIVSQATTDFPHLKKVLAIVRIRLEEGNHAFHSGSLSLAITKYIEALKYQLGAKRQYLPSVQLMYNISAAHMKCNDWVSAVQWTHWTLHIAKLTERHKSILRPRSLEMLKMVHRHVLARLQLGPSECAKFVGGIWGSLYDSEPCAYDSPDEELSLLRKHLGPLRHCADCLYETRDMQWEDLVRRKPHIRDVARLEKISATVTLWEGPELLESGWERNMM